MKAVIVDLQGRYAAALVETGEVRKIANNNYEIGQSIELHEVSQGRKRAPLSKTIKRVGSIAAAVAILAGLGTVTAYAVPYGTVSVEADPSIEYTINCFDYVLRVNGADEAGEAILSELDVTQLRHRKVDKAITATMEQLEERGLLDTESAGVTITAETRSNGHTERLQQNLDTAIHRDMGIPPRQDGGSPIEENPALINPQAPEQQQASPPGDELPEDAHQDPDGEYAPQSDAPEQAPAEVTPSQQESPGEPPAVTP